MRAAQAHGSIDGPRKRAILGIEGGQLTGIRPVRRWRLSEVTLGLICGFAFASLEPALVLFTRWRAAGRGWRVLVVSVTTRFLTGLLIPTVDLGVERWLSGLFLGLALTVPIVVVSRRWVGPLGLGVVGGFVIASIAELVL